MLEKDLDRQGMMAELRDRGIIKPETYNAAFPEATGEKIELMPSREAIVGGIEKAIGAVGGPMAGSVAGAAANSLIGSSLPPVDQAAVSGDAAPTELAPQAKLVSAAPPAPTAPAAGFESPMVDQGLGGLSGAFAGQKRAIEAGAKAGAEQAAKEAAYQQTMIDQVEQQNKIAEEKERARQEAIAKYEQGLNEEIEKMNSKPSTIGQVWANASTGQRIVMGLALFLGSAPGSYAGNSAVKSMQDSIEADLNAAKAAVDNKKTYLGQMRQRFQDERLAEDATRAAYLNAGKLKLEQIASQYKAPQIMANAQGLMAKIDEERAKVMASFQQRAAELAQKQQETLGQDPMLAAISKMPDGRQKELLEAREVYDATEAAKREFDNIYDNYDLGVAAKIPLTEQNAMASTINAQIESAIRSTMKGQGTIQESEITRLVEPFLPSPFDSQKRLEIKKENLKRLLETKNQGQISRLKNAGLMPQQKTLDLKRN